MCGHNLTAGEIGHMVISQHPMRLRQSRLLEASPAALPSSAGSKPPSKTAETVLTDLVGKDLKDMRSGDLRKAIRRGDKFVAKPSRKRPVRRHRRG
jgi:hypothetical protein